MATPAKKKKEKEGRGRRINMGLTAAVEILTHSPTTASPSSFQVTNKHN
jgi:hypothetical protein